MASQKTELCYEFFNCKEYDCIRRSQLTMDCWAIDDVQCQSHSQEFDRLKGLLGKLDACQLCIYYKNVNE